MQINLRKILTIILLAISTNSFAASDTKTNVINTNGVHGYTVYAVSTHNYHIANNTDNRQEYDVWFAICPQFKRCQTANRHISLDAHHEMSDSYTSQFATIYGNSGSYSVEATTTITGESPGKSTGYGYIYVS